MIMLRSTHKAIVGSLIARLEAQALAFEAMERMQDSIRNSFLSQIADLRALVFVPKLEYKPEDYEADNVISASEKPYQMSDEEMTKHMAVQHEADLLMSGNYEQ